MRRRWSRVNALALASALALLLAQAAMGVALVWQLVVTPSSAMAGQKTTFAFVASNFLELNGIGCVEVDIPDGFDLVSYSTPLASNGREWAASLYENGDGMLTVVNQATSDYGKLAAPADTLSFTVTVVPEEAGAAQWTNHVHRTIACDDYNDYGPPLAVTVLAATPTPKPTPTPTPTPKITPTPTPTPTPSPVRATPTPSPTPHPAAATNRPAPKTSPTATPTSTPSPAATPVPTAGGRGAGGVGTTPTPTATPEAAAALVTAAHSSSGSATDDRMPLTTSLAALGMLDAPVVWTIPAVVVGGAGLLVIAWVIIQALGAAIMVPLVRRWDEDERRPRPRRRRT